MQLTCSVCNLHTQDEYKGCIIRSCQVVADQSADFLVEGYEAQPESTGQVWAEEEQDKEASSVLEAVIEIDAGQD